MKSTAALKPLHRRLVYEDVMDAIQNYIVEQKLTPNTRLPSEQELARMLGVGNRSVREALKSLQTRGMVTIRHGKGVYVADDQMNTFLNAISDSLGRLLHSNSDLVTEVILVRRMIEGELTSVAAQVRTDGQLAGLRSLLEQQRAAMQANNVDRYNEMDVEFHEAIVRVAGYRIIEELYRQFYGMLMKTFRRTGHIPGSMSISFPEHEQIFLCIERKDAATARMVVETHINRTLQDVKTPGQN